MRYCQYNFSLLFEYSIYDLIFLNGDSPTKNTMFHRISTCLDFKLLMLISCPHIALKIDDFPFVNVQN